MKLLITLPWAKKRSAASPQTAGLNNMRRQEIIWGLVFVSPMVILTLVFNLYPIFASIRVAMYNWTGIGNPTQYVGLRHIQTVMQDEWFWNALGHTVQYTSVLVPIQLTLTLILAIILNNPRMRFSGFSRTIFFIPIVTSATVVAVVVRLMVSNFGWQLSDLLGATPPVDPISSSAWAMWVVIGFGIWHSFGYNLLYFLSALQTVPDEIHDAARIDGATWWQELLYVTLPVIRPVALVILFMAILGSMSVFDPSFVLTNGGPYFSSEVVSVYIFRYAFGSPDRNISTPPNLGYASAAALFLSFLMMLFTLTQFFVLRYFNKKQG